MEDDKSYLTASAKKRALIHHHNHVIFVSITYMLTIGVSGLVLCAIGSNLEDIAKQIGSDNSTVLGGKVFLFRGSGAIFGTISSNLIISIFDNSSILMFGLFGITVLLFLIPIATSTIQLYIYFFCLGVCSSVNDIGINIATRKLHAKQAGPWLGLNGISFGMAAGIVPIIELLTSNFGTQYHILSMISFTVACMIFYSTNIDVDEDCLHHLTRNATFHHENSMKHSSIEELHPHYNVENVIGWIVFCFVGGQVTFNAFIRTYLNETSVIKESNKVHVLELFWFLVGCSRILGVYDLKYYTDHINDLILHFSICCSIASFFLILIGLFPYSNIIFWLGISFYSFFFGPCISYSYDLNNRLTLPTEKSTIIVMRGINMGSSLVPYLSGYIWDYFNNNSIVLILILATSMIIPLILVQFVQGLSYKTDLENFEMLQKSTLHDFVALSQKKLKASVKAIIGIHRLQKLTHDHNHHHSSISTNSSCTSTYDTFQDDV